jgi:hypothetical protein
MSRSDPIWAYLHPVLGRRTRLTVHAADLRTYSKTTGLTRNAADRSHVKGGFNDEQIGLEMDRDRRVDHGGSQHCCWLPSGACSRAGSSRATRAEDIALSGGQVALVAVVNFLSFVIGGFIVGLKSAGRTIFEPGISAAIAVVIALLISGNFTVVNMVAGGLIPFVAGVIGGWLGERRQGTA